MLENKVFGNIQKVSGARVIIHVSEDIAVNRVNISQFLSAYISVGSLIGAILVDGRTLVLSVEEIYENSDEIYINASISGVYDTVLKTFSFGTDTYPLVGEKVFTIGSKILSHIFSMKQHASDEAIIGTYVYDSNVNVGYNPNVIFGKHLGVFGNTGSGKTCTVVSLIQNYIRNNPNKDIKFIILDVNGEYRTAFTNDESDYIPFDQLRFHHTVLNCVEYGRLFRASEGVQYPALKSSIAKLSADHTVWDLNSLSSEIDQWISSNSRDNFSLNQLNGFLRTMKLRIDGITDDKALMTVINTETEVDTLSRILNSNKKVFILDLQVSSDSLDIVLYMLFKKLYQFKALNRNVSHLNLVLEEAHRYINANVEETKLGSYYIDKLSREGRKFGIGLIIASQVPSMLSYEIVSQCNTVIMHKITSKRDMEFLRGVLRVSNDSFYIQMSALEKQHAIVCGEAFPNDTIVKIRDANPLPRSNDPIIQDLE